MEDIGYGVNYKYPHDYPGHFVNQQYFPDTLQGTRLWNSQENPTEKKLQENLDRHWKTTSKK